MMRNVGFTLIELLVTIAVVAILATIAVPGFQGLLATNRLSADYNEILTGFNYARSEAVKRRQDVTATIAESGGAWSMTVQYDDDSDVKVVMERKARDDKVSVSSGEVVFNALGRRKKCELGGGEVSDCRFSVGSKELVISMSGRVEGG